MSEKYDEYLLEHRDNVYKAFCWMVENIPEIFGNDNKFMSECEFLTHRAHDQSKFEPDEYQPYDAYFYGGNKSYEVVNNFNKAWLLHIHRNPHHWQHWILINDNPEEGEILLDMPYKYIIEMICDWWSFSWKTGNLNEIFTWYEDHRKHMKLSDYTREKVVDILLKINEKLDESDKDGEE